MMELITNNLLELEEEMKQRLFSPFEISNYYIEYGNYFLDLLVRNQPVSEDFLWEFRNVLNWGFVIFNQVFPIDLNFYKKFWDYVKINNCYSSSVGIEAYQPIPLWFVEELYPRRGDIKELFKSKNYYIQNFKFSEKCSRPWLVCYVEEDINNLDLIIDQKRPLRGLLTGFGMVSIKTILKDFLSNYYPNNKKFLKVKVYLEDIIGYGTFRKFEILSNSENPIKRFNADVA